MNLRRLQRAAAMWRWRGQVRPPSAVEPGPGQRSVWDFPRPPRLETVPERVRVELGGIVLADSTSALRICETASPPTYYLPADDVRVDLLDQVGPVTTCEWKGRSVHFDVRIDGRVRRAVAWSYPEAFAPYEAIGGALAFYAGRVDACFVGGDRVVPQPGGYYGGWITPDLVGPFKGEPGSGGW